MALLDDLDSTTRNRVLPNVFRQLIEEDPTVAADWLRDKPDGFAKYRAINEAGYTFANKAPEMAIALAKEIPEMRDNALSSAFSTLASRDLDTALRLAEEWKGDSRYENVISRIASGYGRSAPSEALAWANSLDESVRSSAVTSVVGQLAGEDPNLAVKHLGDLNLSQDDPIYQNSLNNIVSNWAHRDPVSAAEWLDTLPASSVRESAFGQIVDRWARIDPVSASEWIGGLNEGPGRDQAAHQLVNRIQREDLEMAAAWATSIGDENLRNNALQNVFSQWSRMDPEGAAAAAATSPLPEPMQQHILQRAGLVDQ